MTLLIAKSVYNQFENVLDFIFWKKEDSLSKASSYEASLAFIFPYEVPELPVRGSFSYGMVHWASDENSI